MIPIRDSIRPRTFPIANVTLIIVNILIFIHELSMGPRELTLYFYRYGVVPKIATANFLTGNFSPEVLIPFFTTMFLHGGWLHVLSNMLFLWVFGDNIEDRLGHFRYLIFYLLVGIAGSIGQVLANPLAEEPLVGASGAIAGVLGAYFVCFPRSRIVTLIPIFFFFTFVEIPALIFLILWFLIQAFNGLASIGAPGNVVAWWAHIGGFIAGMILIRLFPKRARAYR